MENNRLIAKTLFGLEGVLAEELKNLGAKDIEPAKRAVYFKGDKKIIYKANYQLRTAVRILKEIYTFQFRSVEDYYNKCKNVKWEEIFSINQTFVIHSTVANSKEFTNSMFASLKAKDAISDYFRDKFGRRPYVNTKEPDIVINMHITDKRCFISLDSSGDSLHIRGYKTLIGEAPLSEVLAAGMILLSGWKGETDFLDPMCGSGTLPIEAALIATNTPPGAFRDHYTFKNWNDFDPELFKKVKEEIKPREFKKTVYASDLLIRNINAARINAKKAKVIDTIVFEATSIKNLKKQLNGATIIINPPYGERIEVEEIEKLYELIGERLKHFYPGNEAWIISSSKECLNKIGLKPSNKFLLYNGSLQCSYRKYELFAGKRFEKQKAIE